MICSVFKPSRKKDGKSVRRRLWWGQYRLDGDTRITRIPLHTQDKQVAVERLNKEVKRIQQEREGLIAPAPMRDATSRSVVELGDLYADSLDALGRDDHYVNVTRARVRRLSKECRWKHLRDVTPASFQRWRTRQTTSPRTVNEYLATMRSFFNWLMKQEMAAFDPLVNVQRVEERGRRVKQRRALSVEEVRRLLEAAPLARRQFYMAGYYTGLRRSELEALQWGDIHMDDTKPYILARAATTKNHRDAKLWIRPELLKVFRSMRPDRVAADEPVFETVMDVKGGHKLRRFKRDLKAAGIPYKDAQGRIADFHALSRVTPNTHMGQLGVGERVRQEFMRHSDLRLTSAVYTDVEQLPTMGAIMALPSFNADDDDKGCAQIGAQNSDLPSSDSAGHGEPDWVI
jgi:integrase